MPRDHELIGAINRGRADEARRRAAVFPNTTMRVLMRRTQVAAKLAAGADVNMRSAFNETPLHVAVDCTPGRRRGVFRLPARHAGAR